jgi:hypothetical protein
MLAHSPPLPLVVDYFNILSNYDEGVILALEQRHRVRRVRLCMMDVSGLQKLIMAMDKEYPVLEYLILVTMAAWGDLALVTLKTLEAPNLRHLFLTGVVPPIESRLLTTAVGMVTLCLFMQQPSSYFQPDILVRCLSFMPQLETLLVTIIYPIPDHVKRQLSESDSPITTRVTLPNLRWFQFDGSGTYMEALVRRIIAPCLEKLNIQLNNEFTLPVPHLLQFMNTTNNLRFDSATFEFSRNRGCVILYLREDPEVYALSITVLDLSWHSDMQVLSSAGQIFNSLSQRLSTVEHLSLASPEGNDEPEVDPTEWRKFLRSFRCVKTLSVDDRLVEKVSRCLKSNDAEHPPELLPVLQELTYSGNNHAGGAFTSFVNARQNTGCPVTLNAPSRSSDPWFSESSDVMTESSDTCSSVAWGNNVGSSEAWCRDAGSSEAWPAWGNDAWGSEAWGINELQTTHTNVRKCKTD